MYADVKEIQSGAAHRLQSKLRERGDAVFRRRMQSVLSEAAAAASYAGANNGAPLPGYFVVGDGPVIGSKQ